MERLGNISAGGEVLAGIISQAGPKGDTGETGYTPQKGIDYFTEQDKQELMEELPPHIDEKMETFNQNVENKTNEFNQNATQRITEYNNNSTSKTNDFNQNAADKTEQMINQVIEVEAMIKRPIIEGNSKQDKREGYNKFLNTFVSTTSNGITLTMDKDKMHFEGTSTASTNFRISKKIPSELLGKTATLTVFGLENTTFANAGFKKTLTGANILIVNTVQNSTTVEITQEMIDAADIFDFFITSGKTVNTDIYIQLAEGTEEKPYEQYGVSPSINYPSKVKSVGDNINLFNKDDSEMFLNGITPNNDGLIQTGKTDISGTSFITTIIVPCEPNEKYTITRHLEGVTFLVYESTKKDLVIDDTITFLARKNDTTKISTTITTSETAKYILVKIYNTYASELNTYNDLISSIKIERGSKVTPYSPHGQGSIEIKQDNGLGTTDTNYRSQTKALYTQKPFRSIGNTRDKFIRQNGMWYEEHNIPRIIFDGTENWTFLKQLGNYYQYRTSANFTQPVSYDIWNKSEMQLCSHFVIGDINTKADACFTVTGERRVGMNYNITTVAEFKAKLAELYNAGTPVYVDYVTTTPELIECTPEQVEVLNDIYSAYGAGLTNITCTDEIEPVIEIIKETKETVQSNNDRAISALLERVSQLEAVISSMQTTTAEEGA